MNKEKQHMALTKLLNKAAVFLCAAAIIPGMTSCLNEINEGEEQTSNVTLDTRTLPAVLMNNAVLYVFNANDQNKFIGKQLNVTKTGDMMSTTMPVGKYHLGIITCETEDITSNPQFNLPSYGVKMEEAIMWKTKTTTKDSKEFLNDTPEILYVPINNVDIDPNITTSIPSTQAQLFRHAAQIQFILEDHEGFDDMGSSTSWSHANAFIDLFNVATTLNWEGKYLPSKENPTLSNLIPMRKMLNFQQQGTKMVADPVSFIIPAGVEDSDYKLKFQISMPIGGQPFYGKSDPAIPISFSPKANSIIRVNITKFSGEPGTSLDIKVTVKEWEKEIDQTAPFN